MFETSQCSSRKAVTVEILKTREVLSPQAMISLHSLFSSIYISIDDGGQQGKGKMQYQKQSLFFSQSEDECAESGKVSEMRKVYFDAEEGQRGKRGRPSKKTQIQVKIENQVSQQPKDMITLSTFHKIFMKQSVNIDILAISPSQPPFAKWVFSQIIHDLKYRKTSQQTASSSAKIRTNLIKKITEEYVYFCIPSTKSGQRSLDRKYFQRVGIQQPQSVVSNDYLAKLFSYSPFQQYFQDYVCGNRVREFYLEKCYKEVMEFCDNLESLAYARTSDDRKCDQFRKMRKPMSFIEVRQYQTQASLMLESYSMI